MTEADEDVTCACCEGADCANGEHCEGWPAEACCGCGQAGRQ